MDIKQNNAHANFLNGANGGFPEQPKITVEFFNAQMEELDHHKTAILKRAESIVSLFGEMEGFATGNNFQVSPAYREVMGDLTIQKMQSDRDLHNINESLMMLQKNWDDQCEADGEGLDPIDDNEKVDADFNGMNVSSASVDDCANEAIEKGIEDCANEAMAKSSPSLVE